MNKGHWFDLSNLFKTCKLLDQLVLRIDKPNPPPHGDALLKDDGRVRRLDLVEVSSMVIERGRWTD